MWISHPQKDRILYNFGFVQGLTSPLLLKKAPIGINAGWGLFLWLLQTGPRTGSQLAEQPLSLTFAESGHGNGPVLERRLNPPRTASVPVPRFVYTDKSSSMKLGEKSRYR